MPEKIGRDVIRKRRIRFRKMLNKANHIEIQMKVLEELAKKPMTSADLRQFIENLDGNYYLLLPILKNSGLLEIKEANTSKPGKSYLYSLKKL